MVCRSTERRQLAKPRTHLSAACPTLASPASARAASGEMEYARNGTDSRVECSHQN